MSLIENLEGLTLFTHLEPEVKTNSSFVHSHHIHQHEKDEKFGIKRPIHIDHIVCF